MDFDKLQENLNSIMNEQNNWPVPEFEGYSPSEMYSILYHTFDDISPIILMKADDSVYREIPLLNQIKYFLELIKDNDEIQLTARGFLPPKVVKAIYNQGFMEEYWISSGISKLTKEKDSMTVNLTRLLSEVSGLVKKRKGKLSLTKKGNTIFHDNDKLFQQLFKTMALKFNWAYYDSYINGQIGQIGVGFSLILLHKYGSERLLDKFYAEKYFNAFPEMIDQRMASFYKTPEQHSYHCYSLRTFERFLAYFGLIKEEKTGELWNTEQYITKTALFDKLIAIQPGKNELKKYKA